MDTIKETSPMITPDGLRKINQENKAFYDSHTKKNFGREDLYGSQYSGTVENFGYELLVEAKKHRMEKPSLKGVFGINNYKYYFDLQYSNMIETYIQQGMLEAVLCKDVCIPIREFKLKFENCEEVYIPRSESWGSLNDKTEPKVFKNKFLHTKTPPTLIIIDRLSPFEPETVELRLDVGDDFETDYYFYNEMPTQKFIDTYEDGTLTTVSLTNEDAGLPFVWICNEIFKSLPPVNFQGNELIENKPLLTIGVDGQDVSHIYPIIYPESLPEQEFEGTWYIKAFSELDGFMPNNTNNYNSKISSIMFAFIPDDENKDEIDYEITFEEDYIKISLSDKWEWEIIRNQMNEPYYARIPLETFDSNSSDDPNVILKESFDIGFSENYLYMPYEGLCEGAVSGIHVDIMSDYSENAVPKKNGTIHSLGDYDGLPTYFKVFHDHDIRRSHVELYTIRDRLNRYTQKTMDKQTAGILVDSAMPQDGMLNLLDGDPAIVYVTDPDQYLFVTDFDKVISKKNVISEITFNDENTFGNCKILSDREKQKFIYHGNRTFSLGAIEFDPEMEIARVYYVNNDPLSYVNNALAEHAKPPRTMARICDIPTEYEQLMHIEYHSPTFLFDKKYVRMGANFFEDDLDLLLNKRGLKVVMTPDSYRGNVWLYDGVNKLPSKQTLVECGYVRTVNIHNSHIPITVDNFAIVNGGNGYAINDTFYVLVGGVACDGTVLGTNPNGSVRAFHLELNDDANVSVYNLDGTHTSLRTITTFSENGSDLSLELVVQQSDINSHIPTTSDILPPPDGLIAFVIDAMDNIFIYELQTDWTWKNLCQVEGEKEISNPYSSLTRSFNEMFFKGLLNKYYRADENIFFEPSQYIEKVVKTDYQPARGHKGETDRDDLSEYIVMENMPNTLYRLILTSDEDNGHFDLEMNMLKSLDGYECSLPRFNSNNTLKYYNPTNRLIISDSETINNIQPTLFVYSPTHDIIIDDINEILTDVILVEKSHESNYNDYGSNIFNVNGILPWNVYNYQEYDFSNEYLDLRDDLELMSYSELLTFIRNNFGESSEVFIYSDSEYRYDQNELIEYILDRYPLDKPVYVKDGLKPYAYSGDHVVDRYSGLPIGRRITGSVIPLSAEVVDINVKVDSKPQLSDLENIFLIDDLSFEGFHNDFRIHDENGVDITESSIVIWKKRKYIFYENEWIELLKAVKYAYYNPADNMFYYDPQYLLIITPELDEIYCDINTGQNYKWNGTRYVLIVL